MVLTVHLGSEPNPVNDNHLDFETVGPRLNLAPKKVSPEFFEKQARLYPDYLLNIEKQLVRGASFIRVHDGRIIEWSDYYDELTSRRTTLAEYFRVWIEF